MPEQTKYLIPETLGEALAMAWEHQGGFSFLAGGTDLIPNMKQGTKIAETLIDLSGIKELNEIEIIDDYMSIGSLVTLHELTRSKRIRDEYPVLIEAVNSVAAPTIRKTATLGGNLLCENRCVFFNQSAWWREAAGFCLKCDGDICIATGGKKACFSKFVSDTAPALISMGARVVYETEEGREMVDLEELYSGEGVNPLKLDKMAVLVAVLLPLDQGFRSVFYKLRHRKSLEFTSLTIAITRNTLNDTLKLVVGGVDPGPIVLTFGTDITPDEMASQALKKTRVVDNDLFTRKYRREMIRVFVERGMDRIMHYTE